MPRMTVPVARAALPRPKQFPRFARKLGSSSVDLGLSRSAVSALARPDSRYAGTHDRGLSAWAAATEQAHSVLEPPPPEPSASSGSGSSSSASSVLTSADPLAAIYGEISDLKSSLFRLLGSSHPSLDTMAKYYFHTEGKHLRPLLVLLMSQATNGIAGDGWQRAVAESQRNNVDDSLTSEGGVLNDWNPEMSGPESQAVRRMFADPFRIPDNNDNSSSPSRQPLPAQLPPKVDLLHTSTPSSDSPSILPTQRRLASITEMIHVASLLHDDVIDTSPTRRGQPSAPSAFGNKLSILSGDFLLGRASVALARLGDREVVELLATVIANLVEGEVMQLRATSEPETTPTPKGFEDYMRKTYLKTASLMAKSARAAVILGGCGQGGSEAEWVKDVAYGYGRNLGIAFQVRSPVPNLYGEVADEVVTAHRRRAGFPAIDIGSRQAVRRCGHAPRSGDCTGLVRLGEACRHGSPNPSQVRGARRCRGCQADGGRQRWSAADSGACQAVCVRSKGTGVALAGEQGEGCLGGVDREGRR